MKSKRKTKVYIHKELAQGRWFNPSFFEQMANVGSEVARAINWREKNMPYSIDDAKNKKRLR